MTETDTLTLTDFLLARIEDDEWMASAATPGPWASSIEGRDHFGGDDVILAGSDQDLYPRLTVDGSWNANADNDQDHIARHHPARVLAECEAKRRIVAEHPVEVTVFPAHYETPDLLHCSRCAESDGTGYGDFSTPWPCPTIRALALPYADHPDFREEWKP